jgi:hypothetical protein
LDFVDCFSFLIFIAPLTVQDCSDRNPLVRALALRTMGCIRVEKILEYFCDPLAAALKVRQIAFNLASRFRLLCDYLLWMELDCSRLVSSVGPASLRGEDCGAVCGEAVQPEP